MLTKEDSFVGWWFGGIIFYSIVGFLFGGIEFLFNSVWILIAWIILLFIVFYFMDQEDSYE